MVASGNAYAQTAARNADTNGNGNGYHWDSQVQTFQHADPAKLAEQINAFCIGRFCVGTQTHYAPDKKLWVAFVYYKIRN